MGHPGNRVAFFLVRDLDEWAGNEYFVYGYFRQEKRKTE